MRRLLYRNFKRFHRTSRWLRRRFTPTGFLMTGILVSAGVVGIDTRYTMAYQIASLAMSLIILSFLSGIWVRPRFTVERFLPDFTTAGEAFEYKVRIRNLTAKSQVGLFVRERPDTGLPGFDEFINAREPGEEKRNRFDRIVGYPRWEWLVSQFQGADVDDTPLPPIPPGGQIEVNLKLTPRRRGHIELEGLTIIRPDPLGLMKTAIETELPETLLALPGRVPVPAIDLPGSRHFQPGGITQISSVGDAEEFFSLRDYQPGDALHRVHWRSWARTGKAVVKEFQEEYFVRFGLVLDTFVQPRQAHLLEDAVTLAASFVSRKDSPDALLDLMFVGTQTYCFTSGRGLLSTSRMLEILACVGPSQDRQFDSLRQVLGTRADQLSSCICVLLSWDDARRALVKWLRIKGIAVDVVLISDQSGDIDPGPMRDSVEHFHIVESGKAATAFTG
ncbi:MAG: DUF58 domain-containing protein [Gammaproteobacteria bacterium]|nr:DUF58 domain-containing protein [Gammaproteobacteria bacterium]